MIEYVAAGFLLFMISKKNSNPSVDTIINKVAAASKLPADFVAGIARTESGFRFDAFNPEGSKATPTDNDLALYINQGNPSAGLFQIRWSTAKSLKRLNPSLPALNYPADLFNPDTQAVYATALFKDIKPRAKTLSDIAAIWNAGSIKRFSDGSYYNQVYVSKVAQNSGIDLGSNFA